jgi:hypothetical protein
VKDADVIGRDPKTLWREVDEALSPTNARPSDGNNNYKKLIEIKTCVVGGDKGDPVFVLAAKSPRSSVNNLGLSISWSTYSRAEAAAFLRELADKIEKCAVTENNLQAMGNT